MKKFWNYKLWWRVPCALFTIVGIIVVVVLIAACLENFPGNERRRKTEVYRSDMVKEVTKKGTTNFVNAQTNRIILRDVQGLQYIKATDSLYCFKHNRKRGYINLRTGHIDIQPQYDHAWIFSDGLAAVEKEGRLGFVHPDGSLAIPMRYVYNDELLSEYIFREGYCVVVDSTNHMGVIDTLGNWVLEPLYDNINLCRDYMVAGKVGDFNKQIAYDGTVLNDRIIENVWDISYDRNVYDKECGYEIEVETVSLVYFKYQVQGRYGLMDKTGRFITPPLYMDIRGFGRDMFRNENISFEPNMNIATPSTYVLGAGDNVFIDVFGASQTTIEGIISPDGCIVVEEFGPIQLGGLTVEEANRRVRSKLGAFYADSKIQLTVGQTRTIQIHVMGEVLVPGSYTLSAFATVFHALYSAGGVPRRGGLRNHG